MPDTAPVSSSSNNYDDYGVCYAGDGADLTDYGDTTQTSKPSAVGNCADGVDRDGDASCPTYASGKDAKQAKPDPTLNHDDGVCELPVEEEPVSYMSDERYAELGEQARRAECADTANKAKRDCEDAWAGSEPLEGHCDKVATETEERCVDGDPDPVSDRATSCLREDGKKQCGLEAEAVKDRCLEDHAEVYAGTCEGSDPTLPNGQPARSYDECMDAARYGADEVINRRTKGTSDSESDAHMKGSSSSNATQNGLSVGVPGISTDMKYTHTDTETESDTHTKSHGTSQSDMVGTKTQGADGYGATCEQQKKDYIANHCVIRP